MGFIKPNTKLENLFIISSSCRQYVSERQIRERRLDCIWIHFSQPSISNLERKHTTTKTQNNPKIKKKDRTRTVKVEKQIKRQRFHREICI